jgi:hypothetical protein
MKLNKRSDSSLPLRSQPVRGPFSVHFRFIFGSLSVGSQLVYGSLLGRLWVVIGSFMGRYWVVIGSLSIRSRSVRSSFTGLVGFPTNSEMVRHRFVDRPGHALSLLRDRRADGNGILRPQPMKHLDEFSDDFGDDFGIIFGVILAAGIIALKQGRASLKSTLD